MLPTNGRLASIVFFCLIFVNPALGRAQLPSDISRDAIIQKQMDCVSRNLKSTGIGWQDLCVMPQNQEGKAGAVNQQLNMVESEFSHASALGVEKQFSNSQPYADNTSPNAQPSEQESAGNMLRKFLSPDLSSKTETDGSSHVKARVHSLEAGSEIFYYRYEEPGPGVKIFGPMYGYYADYAYRPQTPNFFNNFLTNAYFLQARYASSRDLEYKGSGIVKGKHDDALEFRGLVGKDYFLGTDSRVTPYFGFGYRYLFDRGDGQLSSINAYGYDRRSHYYYLPLGGDLTMEFPDNWEIDFNTEYDVLIYGLQKSYLSDGDQFNGFHNQDITNNQDKGFGLRASIKFLKRGSLMDFYVEPYIRFWNIEESSVVTASVDGSVEQLVEPKNNTLEIGSRFGIQF